MNTPFLGGIAIFGGLILTILLSVEALSKIGHASLLIILVLTLFVGLMDDWFDLKPLVKIVCQIIIGSLLFSFLDIRLSSFYGFLDVGTLPVLISYLLTVFTFVFISNAFNLIDGIDGLAAAFSLIVFFFFGIWFYLAGGTEFSIMCFALTGCMAAFLIFNWEPSRIFMGDAGSLTIGVILAAVCIQFLNDNEKLPIDTAIRFHSPLITVVCALIVPVTDTIRVVVIRLYKKAPLFAPDKRHIHHALISLGLSHRQGVLLLCLIHVSFIVIAVLLRQVDSGVLGLLLVSLLATVLCFILDRVLLKRNIS